MSIWRVLTDAEAVTAEAVSLIQQAGDEAIARHGEFRLVLAGGSTPREIYRRLATSATGIGKWRLYYGDERCLPMDDPRRNSRMVEESGLAAKAGGHFPIPAELGAEAAASAYAWTIESALPFDLVLLGVGEDGHTASLFPGHVWPETDLVVAVHDAPKPPADRVSLSPRALRDCRHMLVIATGVAKADALHRWQAGDPLPIHAVTRGISHTVLVDASYVTG